MANLVDNTDVGGYTVARVNPNSQRQELLLPRVLIPDKQRHRADVHKDHSSEYFFIVVHTILKLAGRDALTRGGTQ